MTFRKRHTPAAAKPGTLMIRPDAPPPRIRLAKYAPSELQEHDVASADQLRTLFSDGMVHWIDVQGHGSEETLRALAEQFSMHPLALEDIVNAPQRPKTERYDDHTLCIARTVIFKDNDVWPEQISVFIGRNYVLSFHEHCADLFDRVRERIRQGGPIFRASGAAYLAYALIDAVIDSYYPILEEFGERLEELEHVLIARPTPAALRRIHRAKRDLMALRRGIWPQREAINSMIRDEDPLISDAVRVYLRDCYDHCVQIMDALETYRELAGGLMDLYLSSIGNRQNEVMKVLTIMASIFIPLTFMAGIYGMNFEQMPELHFGWAYPTLLATMAAVAVGMIVYFRRKGWINSGRPDAGESDQ